MVQGLGAALAAAALGVPVWGAPVDLGRLPPQAAEATEVLTVDLNGDGLRDVVVGPVNTNLGNEIRPVAPVFLVNKGGGRFVDATQQLFNGPAPLVEWDRELLTADFNRDGRPDLFIADHGHVNDSDASAGRSGAQQHLILSTADGHLVDASKNLPQQTSFTHSAAIADVNGDGAPDIYENNLDCCSNDHTPPQLLLNDGTGHFHVAPNALHGMLGTQFGMNSSYACAFADVNGDGAPDLVLGGSENEDSSFILLNDGKGTFNFFTRLPPSIGPPQNAFVIDIKAADVNGDGAVDLLFAESLNDPWYVGANIQVLINDGHGHFTDETSTRLPQPPQAKSWPDRVLTEDVNDDGRPDLTIAYAPAGVVPSADPTAVYLNHDGVFQRVTAPRDGFGSAGGGIGYVNGDGPHALFSVDWSDVNSGTSHYYVTPEIVYAENVAATRVRRTMRVKWTAAPQATSYQVLRNGKVIATTHATAFVDRAPGAHPRYTVRVL